ncbi:phosphatase [bacterium]|nr:phosphatase [bacterium]
MNLEALNAYEQRGARFPRGVEQVSVAVRKVRLLLFDWDGVFNNGSKSGMEGSGFSEVDSLGTNLLRYGLYLHHGSLPRTAILSGARNETAEAFAAREHFDAVYTQFKDKSEALSHLCSQWQLEPEQVGFFFDDVLDLAPATRCGLRVFLGSGHSASLADFVETRELADVVPARSGGQGGVRESCDLLLEALGVYAACVEDRMALNERYLHFWNWRQTLETQVQRA